LGCGIVLDASILFGVGWEMFDASFLFGVGWEMLRCPRWYSLCCFFPVWSWLETSGRRNVPHSSALRVNVTLSSYHVCCEKYSPFTSGTEARGAFSAIPRSCLHVKLCKNDRLSIFGYDAFLHKMFDALLT